MYEIHESCTERRIRETGFIKSTSHSSTESGGVYKINEKELLVYQAISNSKLFPKEIEIKNFKAVAVDDHQTYDYPALPLSDSSFWPFKGDWSGRNVFCTMFSSTYPPNLRNILENDEDIHVISSTLCKNQARHVKNKII
jgi:hypothetical protein